MDEKQETLTLKWGSVKGYSNLSDTSVDALQKWADLGTSMSAMSQPRTEAHTEALCHAVDVISGNGGVIWDDWNGVEMTADEAKTYLREYRK